MKLPFPHCCLGCEHRTDDCQHELRDDFVLYFYRNPDATCPVREQDAFSFR